jgi:hypothetical protein
MMTNLSPAAQAVLNAAIEVSESADAEAIAVAVLRTAINHVSTAQHILDIANELEDYR